MFRFTIRELLLLTVIVALGVAWWTDHRRQEKQIQRLKVSWPQFILDTF